MPCAPPKRFRFPAPPDGGDFNIVPLPVTIRKEAPRRRFRKTAFADRQARVNRAGHAALAPGFRGKPPPNAARGRGELGAAIKV